MYNDVFWQNRSFFIGVGGLGTGQQNQQSVVTLYDSFTTTAAETQPQADATTANGSGTIITGYGGLHRQPKPKWQPDLRQPILQRFAGAARARHDGLYREPGNQ
jgi:hypothetical protein